MFRGKALWLVYMVLAFIMLTMGKVRLESRNFPAFSSLLTVLCLLLVLVVTSVQNERDI